MPRIPKMTAKPTIHMRRTARMGKNSCYAPMSCPKITWPVNSGNRPVSPSYYQLTFLPVLRAHVFQDQPSSGCVGSCDGKSKKELEDELEFLIACIRVWLVCKWDFRIIRSQFANNHTEQNPSRMVQEIHIDRIANPCFPLMVPLYVPLRQGNHCIPTSLASRTTVDAKRPLVWNMGVHGNCSESPELKIINACVEYNMIQFFCMIDGGHPSCTWEQFDFQTWISILIGSFLVRSRAACVRARFNAFWWWLRWNLTKWYSLRRLDPLCPNASAPQQRWCCGSCIFKCFAAACKAASSRWGGQGHGFAGMCNGHGHQNDTSWLFQMGLSFQARFDAKQIHQI